MFFLSKNADARSMCEAKDYVAKIKKELSAVVGRTKTQDPMFIEIVFLAVLGNLCSSAVSNGAAAHIRDQIGAIIPESDRETAVTVFDMAQRTFQNALESGSNPVLSVFNGQIMRLNPLAENPFFVVDAKALINSTIRKLRVSDLYSCCFPEDELKYPEPRVYLDRSKAPRKLLSLENPLIAEFYRRIGLIDYKGYTYKLYINQSDKWILCRDVKKDEYGATIELFKGSQEELAEILDIHNRRAQAYSMYSCPLY